ncbi:MAG: hypothetical protein IJH61_04680, partial [Eubacteriaceae bacterium]|nr:hypothetical protein [Eubacteriaceae bacterium]
MKTIRTKAIQLLLGFALTLGLMLGLTGPAMAQTTPTYQEVSSWDALQAAIDNSSTSNPAYIKLTATCNNPNPYYSALSISGGKSVVLDLNGQTINRNLPSSTGRGQVIRVTNGGQLTLEDKSPNGGGKITGGRAKDESGNGCGAVFVGFSEGSPATTAISKFTMTGGTIEGNISEGNGGGVYVFKQGEFTMKGGTIQNNSAIGNGGGVFLYDSTSAFTMDGGMIGSEDPTKGNRASYGGGVYNSSSNVTFTMNGGSISNNSATSRDYGGGGVYSNGPFIMKNKAVIQNNHASHGGGVYLRGTHFTMTDSTISGNEATSGGGVYLISTDFTMNDGTISGNEATSSGGGVCANEATFNMQSGAIQGNTAGTYGGGVFFNIGTFTMSGGAIQGNTASASGEESYGGGVYISGGNFTMQGGIIGGEGTSNTATNGGGVYVNYSGTFT